MDSMWKPVSGYQAQAQEKGKIEYGGNAFYFS
jgi:YHS domain-containing protein